jgi:thiamine-phosphate pyrophosphorylase
MKAGYMNRHTEPDYTLYLVTDRELMSTQTLEECVERAIAGGATMIQLREKNASSHEFYETALRIHAITLANNIPLIINDRVDIAVAANAEGVHVGQSDLPCGVARNIIGADKIVGVSAGTVAEALSAEEAGADYLGVGAMHATGTKGDANIVSTATLKRICDTVSIPVVAIGGINKDTVPQLRGTGISGIAVVSAIVAAPDVTQAARELKASFVDTCLRATK